LVSLGSVWSLENLVEKKVEGKKMWRKKILWRKWVFFSYLDQGTNARIWMRNLNVDELLKSFWYHLNNTRLEKVRNFPQTFLTILWGKFCHLFITIFPPNFPPYFFSLWFSLNQTQEKNYCPNFFSFHQIFQGPNRALIFWL